jgi:hypothetical protein
MNRSRRRRLALRVLAVMLGLGAIGIGGVAFAQDSGTAVNPGDTVIAPTDPGQPTGPAGFAPDDVLWL